MDSVVACADPCSVDAFAGGGLERACSTACVRRTRKSGCIREHASTKLDLKCCFSVRAVPLLPPPPSFLVPSRALPEEEEVFAKELR